MKTIKELKTELDYFPDHYLCNAYEGEGSGIVIHNVDKPFKDFRGKIVEGMYDQAGWIDLEPS